MLPAAKRHAISLADVMPSCLAALSGHPNRLDLPRVDNAIVLLVDGLGASALKARAGHSRTLAPQLTAATTIHSGFPTTTAAALATLTTGTSPGQHGLVGYTVLDPERDRVINQLSGWDAAIDPREWQPIPTIFERATDAGLTATVVAPERYRSSGFSSAILRGATWVAGAGVGDRLDRAAELLRGGGRGIHYVYVPELDKAGHATGWESPEWTDRLESLDGAVRDLVAQLGPRDGLIVTADHGVLDVPHWAHVLYDDEPALLDGVRFVAGEPRCLQLHFEPDASDSVRESTTQAWRESEGDRSWIATRAEAIAADWFGEVRPQVAPRIGDVLIAARKNIAYYDSANSGGRSMVGQHGSWSPEETKIPLLRFGAFAR